MSKSSDKLQEIIDSQTLKIAKYEAMGMSLNSKLKHFDSEEGAEILKAFMSDIELVSWFNFKRKKQLKKEGKSFKTYMPWDDIVLFIKNLQKIIPIILEIINILRIYQSINFAENEE